MKKGRPTSLLVFGVLLALKRDVICTETNVPRIAIIGGGIGGASTSHFLTELLNGSLQIDLYEAKIIGGRLATVKIDNDEFEAGGSVIHPKNMYMKKFINLLGLEAISLNKGDPLCGIWNGDEFAFIESSCFITNLIKLWYRYGYQVFKLQSYVDDVFIKKFVKIYDLQDAGRFYANVTAMLSAMDEEFPKLLQTNMKEHFMQKGFTERLIDEMAEAAVVTNYGQDTNIQSFVGAVSLAGIGCNLWSIKNGNKEVPEHLIYRNKHVNVIPGVVTRIRYMKDNNDSRQYEVTYTNKDDMNPMTSNYNIVIIAAPLTHDQAFPIEFVEFPDNFKFPGSYQTTYATFVKADRLNPEYFGLQNTLNCVLSCNPNKTIISSVSNLNSVDESAKESSRVWKIFSREPMDSRVIHDMFSHIKEKKQIAWKAYPRYSSTNAYPGDFKLHDTLYYVNAIEWAASAMEMSAIAGRNVAILSANDFLQTDSSMPSYKDMHKKLNPEL